MIKLGNYFITCNFFVIFRWILFMLSFTTNYTDFFSSLITQIKKLFLCVFVSLCSNKKISVCFALSKNKKLCVSASLRSIQFETQIFNSSFFVLHSSFPCVSVFDFVFTSLCLIKVKQRKWKKVPCRPTVWSQRFLPYVL